MMTRPNNNGGFTIIELMIAISILAILLLVSSVVMISIGSIYSKGIDMANVQNDSRNIIQDLTSTIQFSGQPMESGSYTYPGGNTFYATCFGSTRYSYVIGFQSTQHILWKDTMNGTGFCVPLNLAQTTPKCPPAISMSGCMNSISGSGSEMVGPNMHLATFSIQQPINLNRQLYSITIGLAYGLEDMFETNSSGTPIRSNNNYVCGDQAGQDYCATSTLTALADERLQQ